MALPVGIQLRYWGIAAAVFFVLLWSLGNVILPFVAGAAVAYFLDPVADRLEAVGFSRVWATIVITAGALLIFVVAALLVIPTLINQSVALVNIAPSVVHDLQAWLTTKFPSLMDENSILRQSLNTLGQKVQDKGGELIQTVLSSAMSVINLAVLMVVVPVVAFYLLLDWDRMVAIIDDHLPRDHAPVIRSIAREVDQTLASFIRGQVTVCIILGTYYAVGLMLTGLQFGMVVGFVAGLISFIPYVGALTGGAVALGLALFQFWGMWGHVAAVVAVFLIGQFIEGNILSPKLVGHSVGLHPVWLIFALSAFGSVFGFVGMLVAVPMAAALGVIARFFLARYKHGRLYQGLGAGEIALDTPPPDDDA